MTFACVSRVFSCFKYALRCKWLLRMPISDKKVSYRRLHSGDRARFTSNLINYVKVLVADRLKK